MKLRHGLMAVRASYVLLIAGALSVALLLAGTLWLHEAWRGGYVVLFQATEPLNIVGFKIRSFFERSVSSITASSEPGLPRVRLYVPEKAQAALMEDMPANVKNWQRGYMAYPDGGLERVKVRHRGDNPLNWAFAKKSWRVKTRKKKLLRGVRTFNYVMPQEANLLENYLAYDIARRVGILSPRARMIELFINDRSYGIYTETEHLDESFLRNNGLMPVNLYKGEQYNAEREMMTDSDLFNNPALWTKVAVFNQLPGDDVSDLAFIFDLVRRAETDDAAFQGVLRMAPLDDWARFAAFQSLVQSWHNSDVHNQRLVSDPWRGAVVPVVHDTVTSFGGPDAPVLDHSAQTLLGLYNTSSDFQLAKYRALFGMVEGGALEEAAADLEKMLAQLRPSLSRDTYRVQQVWTTSNRRDLTAGSVMEAEWNRLIENIRNHARWLRSQLSRPVEGGWRNIEGRVELIVSGPLPMENVTLDLKPGSPAPRRIAWDRDGNGRLSPPDAAIPFRLDEGRLVLDAAWLANRVLAADRLSGGDRTFNTVVTAPTLFGLVADMPLSIASVTASNGLTATATVLAETGSGGGVTPVRLNRPVIENGPSSPAVWRGVIDVEGTLIVEGPVRMEAGTTIRMAPGANLVFRGRVRVEGTDERPVSVIPAVESEPWGVFALQGMGTAGSRINGLRARYGSGGWVDGISYSGMLSVHDTRDVIFRGLTLSDNRNFDDMMHVVYADGITLEDFRFEGAHMDALDVDIATIRIRKGTISGAGNDAIDLMSSRALIEDTTLLGSADKGLSVGERSEVLVFNSLLKGNGIGIESKDASIARVVNSNLAGNRIQAHAYAKNWRYGTGGTIVLEKTVVSASAGGLSAEKRSRIRIFDSTLPGGAKFETGRITVDNSSTAIEFQPATTAALEYWGITGGKDQRGMLQ